MEIFHISAECYPVAKVGGLADVVGALPKYQRNSGAFDVLINTVGSPSHNTGVSTENAAVGTG